MTVGLSNQIEKKKSLKLVGILNSFMVNEYFFTEINSII